MINLNQYCSTDYVDRKKPRVDKSGKYGIKGSKSGLNSAPDALFGRSSYIRIAFHFYFAKFNIPTLSN